MKLILTLVFGIVVTTHAQQTRWMKPDKFRYNPGDTCRMTLVEGERLIGKYFPVGRDSVGKVTCLINGKLTDLTPALQQNGRYHFAIPLLEEGSYQFTWDRHRIFSLSKMEDIETYMAEIGVGGSPATMDKSLEINEHTYDILLVQVGKTRTPVSPVTDFSLEIIPDNHPYKLKKGDSLGLLIKDHSAPVFGFEVIIKNRYDDRTTIQRVFTEKNGTMRLIISSPGPWMIHGATVDTYRNIRSGIL